LTVLRGGLWHVLQMGRRPPGAGRLGAEVSAEAAEHAAALAPLDRVKLLSERAAVVAELRAATQSSFSDQELLAHLRAAELHGQSPATRIMETTAWRRSSGIDKLVSSRDWRTAERELRQVLKCDYLGVDLQGRPVLVQRVGAWDLEAVEAAAEDTERFVLLNAMVCEFLIRMPRPAKAKDPRGIVVIMDMEGLGLRHLSSKLLHSFGSVCRVIRAFYPDMLSHIFVVNAPWVFTALKAAIRPLFTADTLSKVFVTAGVPPEITGLGEACLPEQLRGLRQSVFPYDEGAPPSRAPRA